MYFHRASLPLLGALSLSARAAPQSEDLTAQRPGIIQLSLKAPRARDKRQVDIDLTYTSNFKYDVEFSLGTPGQKIVGSFDTGSVYIWVREKAEASVNTAVAGARSYFDKSSSSTLVRTGESKTTGYNIGGNSSHQIDLYRDNMSLGDGGVLLGGVNRKKFWGRLGKQKMTVHPFHGKDYVISFNEVSATAENGSKSSLSRSDEGIPALLDTGTLLNKFPPSVFQSILKRFPGAKPMNKYPLYIVDCSLRDVNASIDLAFGKTTIKMPYSNFILSIEKPECVLVHTVLGQVFMRGAYIVMDQDNSEVYLANAVSCGSEPVAIDKDVSAISSLTGKCQPPVVEQNLLPWKRPGIDAENCVDAASEDVCGTAEYCRIFPGAFGSDFETEDDCLAAHEIPLDD
ncbi:Aspartic proteinase 3 [Metarhizium brunneum]|uniref:Aspartic proteinase 3 n=1 Tax=Metarhizium brunneum TaxID=500148 RepID=A0A7D5Z4Z7_9HYPO|nr:Aspartic proteinase 3 [Metarhizium brunneum]